jgi:hypothetical protein
VNQDDGVAKHKAGNPGASSAGRGAKIEKVKRQLPQDKGCFGGVVDEKNLPVVMSSSLIAGGAGAWRRRQSATET